mmetsp:Transcript_55314/g.149159  ORF Transcript_55314/g.149159 Transcript_55314/m.149159 type:complete len:270 (+) Transcript_55314:893-1702(+)
MESRWRLTRGCRQGWSLLRSCRPERGPSWSPCRLRRWGASRRASSQRPRRRPTPQSCSRASRLRIREACRRTWAALLPPSRSRRSRFSSALASTPSALTKTSSLSSWLGSCRTRAPRVFASWRRHPRRRTPAASSCASGRTHAGSTSGRGTALVVRLAPGCTRRCRAAPEAPRAQSRCPAPRAGRKPEAAWARGPPRGRGPDAPLRERDRPRAPHAHGRLESAGPTARPLLARELPASGRARGPPCFQVRCAVSAALRKVAVLLPPLRT